MILLKTDDIEFKLREYQDFSWLNNYGKIFYVIDETGVVRYERCGRDKKKVSVYEA